MSVTLQVIFKVKRAKVLLAVGDVPLCRITSTSCYIGDRYGSGPHRIRFGSRFLKMEEFWGKIGVWGHSRELCKNGSANRADFYTGDRPGPEAHRVRLGSRSSIDEGVLGENRGILVTIVNCAKTAERIEQIFVMEIGMDPSFICGFTGWS
jgi:hypothetical protein